MGGRLGENAKNADGESMAMVLVVQGAVPRPGDAFAASRAATRSVEALNRQKQHVPTDDAKAGFCFPGPDATKRVSRARRS